MENEVIKIIVNSLIPWIGILAVFIVFQLQRIDQFAQNRKKNLISHFESQLKSGINIELMNAIQNIYKSESAKMENIIYKKVKINHKKHIEKTLLQIKNLMGFRDNIIEYGRWLLSGNIIVLIISLIVMQLNLEYCVYIIYFLSGGVCLASICLILYSLNKEPENKKRSINKV